MNQNTHSIIIIIILSLLLIRYHAQSQGIKLYKQRNQKQHIQKESAVVAIWRNHFDFSFLQNIIAVLLYFIPFY